MRPSRNRVRVAAAIVLLPACLAGACASAPPKKIDYSEYVWPPPPAPPRIQLTDLVLGRAETVAKSRIQQALLGSSPPGPYDWLKRPFAVAYDAQGRLLVTDSILGAVFRFDRAARRADVLGTQGAVPLRTPLGLDVGRDGRIYIADVGIKKVVALDPEGKVRAVYGEQGELENPTDAAVSPDGRSLFVTDSKAHRVVVFDIASGRQQQTIGQRGKEEGEFSFPSAVAFDSSGNLLVVDQINARVQILTEKGRFLSQFGGLGVGFANFVRPKDVAVDEAGRIYVTDAAFGNVQIFDANLRLLTFVGSFGESPGQFRIASGVAAHGNEFAVVDQLGRRVEIFRYLAETTGAEVTDASRAAAAPATLAAETLTKPAPERPKELPPRPTPPPVQAATYPPVARPAPVPGPVEAPATPAAQPAAPASVSAPPAAQPETTPEPARGQPPAEPAGPRLSSVSPAELRPGVVEVELRGSGLRPDLQARVTRRGVGIAGVQLVRQRFVDSTLFRIVLRVEPRTAPGECELGFDDPRKGKIAPVRLILVR